MLCFSRYILNSYENVEGFKWKPIQSHLNTRCGYLFQLRTAIQGIEFFFTLLTATYNSTQALIYIAIGWG